MITVHKYSDRISIEGHANFAENGKDIVCAGVSTLAQTLIQSVEDLTEDKIQYDIQPGAVDIKFWCLSDLAKVLVDAFFIGVELIISEYPSNVELCKH